MFCVGLHVSAQKFALVDMEYILKNIPAYERANEQLNQVSKKWQAEVDALTTEAQTLYKNYQNEVVFLSQEQKKAKQDAIVAKEKEAADLKKKYFGPDGELFKKRTALMNPIQEEVTLGTEVFLLQVGSLFLLGNDSVLLGLLLLLGEEHDLVLIVLVECLGLGGQCVDFCLPLFGGLVQLFVGTLVGGDILQDILHIDERELLRRGLKTHTDPADHTD